MQKVYIVGGNGFARECYLNLSRICKTNPDIQFAGFLGHGGYGHTVDYLNLQEFYIGEVSEHKFEENEYVIIGAGYPGLRGKIYNELKQRNIKFFNLITDDSKISDSVNLGEANVVISSELTANINVGNCNVFNTDIIVGHDSEIGDLNFFGPRSQVLGNVKIGNSNQIGANTIFLPKAKIGDNNKFAPLSAVYKGCRNNSYMSGNPALKLGTIE